MTRSGIQPQWTDQRSNALRRAKSNERSRHEVLLLVSVHGKLCINGHEYAKDQLARQGIAFTALDNGVLSCAEPKRLQRICYELSAEKIDALLRKWLKLLPHPFSAADRKEGYRYAISILQAEFS